MTEPEWSRYVTSMELRLIPVAAIVDYVLQLAYLLFGKEPRSNRLPAAVFTNEPPVICRSAQCWGSLTEKVAAAYANLRDSDQDVAYPGSRGERQSTGRLGSR